MQQYQMKLCRANQVFRLLYWTKEDSSHKLLLSFGSRLNQKLTHYREWMYEHLNQEQYPCTKEEFASLLEACQSLLLNSISDYLYSLQREGRKQEALIIQINEKAQKEFKRKLFQIRKNRPLP